MSNLVRMLKASVSRVFNERKRSVLTEIWITSRSVFSRGVGLRALLIFAIIDPVLGGNHLNRFLLRTVQFKKHRNASRETNYE